MIAIATTETLSDNSIINVVLLQDSQTKQPLCSLECRNKGTAENIAKFISKLQKNGDITSVFEPEMR